MPQSFTLKGWHGPSLRGGFARGWGGAGPLRTRPPGLAPLRTSARALIDKSARCLRQSAAFAERSAPQTSLPACAPFLCGRRCTPATSCRPPPPTARTRAAPRVPGSPSTATTRRAVASSPPTTSGEGAAQSVGRGLRPPGSRAGARPRRRAPAPWTAPGPPAGPSSGPAQARKAAATSASPGPPDPVPTASTPPEGPTWRLGRGLEAVGDGPASSLPGGLIFPAPGVFL